MENNEVNKSIEELTEAVQGINEFLENEKEEEEQQQLQQAEQQQAEAEANEIAEAEAEAEAQTYAETIQSINDNLYLNNCISIGTICFIGIFTGILLMKIFWDRFRK